MPRSRPTVAVALVFAALRCFAAGNGMDPVRLARIPRRMQEFVDQGKTAGVVTLLMRHGQPALLSAAGWQDREAKTPMTADTIFAIHSMTKPVTSVGVMILVEEGRLALIDPVEKFLPEFKEQKVAVNCTPTCTYAAPSRPINIRDLLTHTSGYQGGGPALQDERGRAGRTLAEVVAVEARQALLFQPGTKWQYSNAGMAALGRIIEVVSGQRYEQFIEARVLRPLGMQDSSFFAPEEKRNRIAAVYTDNHGVLERAELKLSDQRTKYPAPEGGLYSTATDMARFYQMMLNGGDLDDRRILSTAAVRAMTQVYTGELPAGFAPGVGWGLGRGIVRNLEGTFRLNSIGTYGHGGAWRTYGWGDPAKDRVGVILMQRTNNGGDIADEIDAFMQMAAAAVLPPL